ncbi:MAG: polysaccharide deacetylase family protein [Oscillospiraceae bacterium]|nr:polysaccharide deacetylase family protein [Oscillospiraceae bacterium]
MKNTRIMAMILVLCLILSSCGRNKKESGIIEKEEGLSSDIQISEVPTQSEPEEPVMEEIIEEPIEEPEKIENDIADLEELSPYFQEFADLKSEQVPWGPGTNYNENGTPIACVDLQKTYGKYSADFYREGTEHEKKVYLTFDEGYENGYTSQILDVLKEKGVSAVFFITLSYAKSEPELVQRMIDEGHVVGNHSSRHPNMTQITMEEAYAEIADLHNYVSENFGYDMYLFRPPEGAFSERTLALLEKMNYRTVCWSFAYADWDPDNQMEHQKAFERITRNIHDGEIYLLHAVSATNTAILGDVIDYVRSQGYTFEKYLP